MQARQLLLALPLLFSISRAEARPAWCIDDKSDDDAIDRAVHSDDPVDSVPGIVTNLCFPDTNTQGHEAELEARRGVWSQRLWMTDADWRDAAVWAARSQSDRGAPTLRSPTNIAWSALDAVDQYLTIASHFQNDPSYVADAFGTQLSMLGRLAYVQRCLQDDNIVGWAMCQADVAALDPIKASAELRADKNHDGYVRFVIRVELAKTIGKLPQHADDVKQAQAKDDAYAKMFPIAAKATADWDAFAKTHGDLLALALSMEDVRITNSRKLAEGCDDKAWAAWEAALASLPAKQLSDARPEPGDGAAVIRRTLEIIGSEPAGYLAAISLYNCHANDDKMDVLVRQIAIAFAWPPGLRGPRNAIATAIREAGLQLDNRSASIDYPREPHEWMPTNGSLDGGGEGVIAKLQPKGDMVTISFAKKLVAETVCTAHRTTNRWVLRDRAFVQEQECTADKTVMLDERPNPQTVKARYAKGLKAGMRVQSIEDVVVAAYTKPGWIPALVTGVAMH